MPESKVRKAAAEKRKRSGQSAKSEKSGDRTSSVTKSEARKTSRAVSAGERARSGEPPRKPWLLPVTAVLAVLGIAWGAVSIVDASLVPYMETLGNWNIAIAAAVVLIAVIGFFALRPRRSTPQAPGSRRWVAPTFITVGLLGVAWLIVYYIAGTSIPVMSALGNWNILIGMGGMAAAFIIATLWK